MVCGMAATREIGDGVSSVLCEVDMHAVLPWRGGSRGAWPGESGRRAANEDGRVARFFGAAACGLKENVRKPQSETTEVICVNLIY